MVVLPPQVTFAVPESGERPSRVKCFQSLGLEGVRVCIKCFIEQNARWWLCFAVGDVHLVIDIRILKVPLVVFR